MTEQERIQRQFEIYWGHMHDAVLVWSLFDSRAVLLREWRALEAEARGQREAR